MGRNAVCSTSLAALSRSVSSELPLLFEGTPRIQETGHEFASRSSLTEELNLEHEPNVLRGVSGDDAEDRDPRIS